MVWVVSLLTANIIARGLTPEAKAHGIRSLIGPGSRVGPQSPFSSSTPMWWPSRLVPKLFRGERDISGYDCTVSPPHRSCQNFSTFTASVLQRVLPHLQPAHG